MLSANDKNGIRVRIDEVQEGEKYYCPACNEPLILKNNGTIIAHHFAHKGRENCDPYYSTENSMSEWHRNFQNIFPRHAQERVVWNTEHTEYHIADVMFKYEGETYVIEFQHSQISREEFDIRSKFYRNLGYRLFWVFDFREPGEKLKKIYYREKNEEKGTMSLIWPGPDRVNFLENLNMLDYAKEGYFNIYFHMLIGQGRQEYRCWDGNPYSKWTYYSLALRERYFVEMAYYGWSSLYEFDVYYHSEKDFYEMLSEYVNGMEQADA